jgi:hypothetical protein
VDDPNAQEEDGERPPGVGAADRQQRRDRAEASADDPKDTAKGVPAISEKPPPSWMTPRMIRTQPMVLRLVCAGGPRRAPPRVRRARPRVPRPGAAPAAAAHLRAPLPSCPDPPGARASLPGTRRRGRRTDDAPRDRGAACADNRIREAPGRGRGAACEPADDPRRRPRSRHSDRRGTAPAPVPCPPTSPSPRSANACTSRATPLRQREGHLPQAQRHLPQQRCRARPRTRAALNELGFHAIGVMTRSRPEC